ncbi:MAG: thiamine phosphate synthase [Verrucomicrobiota bacterium]
MSPDAFASAQLYGILDLGYVEETAATETTRHLIEGGVDVLQIRWKKGTPGQIEQLSREVFPMAAEAGVPLIINDHPEIATNHGDGVHVGQDDGPMTAARRKAGAGKIVGRSTHGLAQAEAADAEGADYIGFGPLFATPTKPGRPAIGLEEIAEVHRRVSIPVFCIGGIKLENLPEIVEAGARRVVIVSGILQAESIESYIREVKALLPPL